MVTYGDVGRRHVIYGVALLQVILFAEYTLFLTALLLVDMGLVCWHMNTPYAFTGIAMSCTPVAASLCVTLSHHTWWYEPFPQTLHNCPVPIPSVHVPRYAHGMNIIGIPLWLCPVHGLFVHWALDVYWLVTLTDARKAALP